MNTSDIITCAFASLCEAVLLRVNKTGQTFDFDFDPCLCLTNPELKTLDQCRDFLKKQSLQKAIQHLERISTLSIPLNRLNLNLYDSKEDELKDVDAKIPMLYIFEAYDLSEGYKKSDFLEKLLLCKGEDGVKRMPMDLVIHHGIWVFLLRDRLLQSKSKTIKGRLPLIYLVGIKHLLKYYQKASFSWRDFITVLTYIPDVKDLTSMHDSSHPLYKKLGRFDTRIKSSIIFLLVKLSESISKRHSKDIHQAVSLLEEYCTDAFSAIKDPMEYAYQNPKDIFSEYISSLKYDFFDLLSYIDPFEHASGLHLKDASLLSRIIVNLSSNIHFRGSFSYGLLPENILLNIRQEINHSNTTLYKDFDSYCFMNPDYHIDSQTYTVLTSFITTAREYINTAIATLQEESILKILNIVHSKHFKNLSEDKRRESFSLIIDEILSHLTCDDSSYLHAVKLEESLRDPNLCLYMCEDSIKCVLQYLKCILGRDSYFNISLNDLSLQLEKYPSDIQPYIFYWALNSWKREYHDSVFTIFGVSDEIILATIKKFLEYNQSFCIKHWPYITELTYTYLTQGNIESREKKLFQIKMVLDGFHEGQSIQSMVLDPETAELYRKIKLLLSEIMENKEDLLNVNDLKIRSLQSKNKFLDLDEDVYGDPY